jgi:uncharacterized membrane protein YgcG
MTAMTARLCLPVLALVLCTVRAPAEEATPVPEFTGDRVRVAGVPDRYAPLRDDIRELERSSAQTYYVIVVTSTGAGKNATRDYTNRLGETWARQAEAQGLKLDPDRSVLVVLAVNDRKLSVHPGTVLREEYGLNEQAIDRDLVQPHFIPYAKNGQYAEGLRVLLHEIDHWVAAKDTARRPQPLAAAPTVNAAAPEPAPEPAAAPQTAPAAAPPARSRFGPAQMFALGILGAAVLAFAAQSLRYALVRRSTVGRFEGFRERVMRLREGVEALKERHKLLTATDREYTEPMAGHTLAVYQRVKADADRLWDAWLQKMDVWDQADRLIRSAHFPRVRPLAEAGRLLDGLGALEEVERLHAACAGDMDRLEKAHQQAQADLRSAEEGGAALKQQLEAVRQAPLPTAPYEPELEACTALAEQARGALRADPLGAQATLADARQKREALGGRIEKVLSQFKRARQVHDALEEAARRVAEARAGGLRLTETGGNPDPLLEQGRGRHGEALAAVQRGDPDAAAGHLDRAQALADEARGLIDRQAAARTRCREQVPARRTEAQRLHQAAAEAQRQRDELERAFAPDSWKDVAGNVARAEGLLREAGPLLDQAAAAAGDDVQHYFQAVTLLDQVQQHQHDADGLLAAVGPRLQQLTRLRQECQAAGQELDGLAQRVERFVAANDAVVRQPGRDLLRTAEGHRREVAHASASPRPDWPAVQGRLAEAQRGFAAAQQEAEKDVRSHQDLLARLEEAERQAGRVGDFLSAHGESRARAGERYRAACMALERARHESGAPQSDWPQLLRQAQDAAGGLAEAQRLAEEDVRLAQQAAAEVAEAERELAQARAYSALGIAADVTAAAGRLADGRRHLDGQAYEQALEFAGSARRAARAAYDEAVARANQEQQRRDQEQRRLEEERRQAADAAAAAAAAAAAPPPAPAMNLTATAPEREPAPPPQDAGTPPGPWSTGTSQSSW